MNSDFSSILIQQQELRLRELNKEKQNILRNRSIKRAVCVISTHVSQSWVDFLSSFTEYDVYLILDDNYEKEDINVTVINNVKIVQINSKIPEKFGFKLLVS